MQGDKAVIAMLNKVLTWGVELHQSIFSARPPVSVILVLIAE